MDEFLVDIYTTVYRRWILCQHRKHCQIEEIDDGVRILTKDALGHVHFYPNNIIEMTVVDLEKKENAFYLHFQMKNLTHAVELFNEMFETIENIIHKPSIKVLLSCTGGLTTGYFADRINEVAKLLCMNIHVDAIGYGQLYKVGEQYDMILLAPQISYLCSKVQEIFKSQVVLKIPSPVFAKYDVKEILTLIEEEKNQKRIIVDEKHKPIRVHNQRHTGKKILCLSLIRNSNRVHIIYRLYDGKNRILENNEIIKPTLKLQDYYDVIDSELAQYPDIEVIGLSTPGILHKDYIDSLAIEGQSMIDIAHDFTSRYKQKFVFGNDVNAIALGYYTMQDQYSSLSCIFQPISTHSGSGHIVDGRLLLGKHNVAGEVQFLPLNYSDNVLELHTTPEGAVEAMAKTIVSTISYLDPELIVLCCFLITDLGELKKEIMKYIPEEYIPEIVQIDYLQEYMLLGTLMLCHQQI